MFQISKQIDYGVRLVIALTKKQGETCSLNEISRAEKLPYRFLAKTATKLKKKGILESKQGVDGGYFLAKSPDALTLADIVRALEGERGLVACLKTGGCKMEKACRSKPIWAKLQKEVVEKMEEYKIVELATSN